MNSTPKAELKEIQMAFERVNSINAEQMFAKGR